jgi:hypothetical protein
MSQNKRSMAPSVRISFFDLVAGIIDASCNIVFLLIQLELRKHPTNLALHFVAIAGIANRPKDIRIHLGGIPCSLLAVTFQFIWKFPRRRLV